MAVSLSGSLLVAGPRLVDPNFWRTVVLVCRHDEEGALGLVLNRPSEIPVAEPFPGWVETIAEPEVVFVGGPVEPEMAVALARLLPEHIGRPESDSWTPIDDRLGLLDLSVAPGGQVGALESLRVFAGYAGWTDGQLDFEVSSGDWFVVDSQPEDAFSYDPLALWRAVLRRQQGHLAFFADFPPHPSLN
jgi:putative transcriptional regulator